MWYGVRPALTMSDSTAPTATPKQASATTAPPVVVEPGQVPADAGAAQQEETPTPAPEAQPPADWRLILVNPWHRVPDGYDITFKKLNNGLSVDERCYPDLKAMIDDCRAAGLSPYICAAFRTQKQQQALYDNKVRRLMNSGYARADALVKAGTVVAVPGTSEHQLGLALDIVDENNQNLTPSQEKTAVQRWLMKNSWRYGFILRYPSGKSDITGIIYEPWHYRYVGREAAQYIYEQGICLEEYLAL